jgi:uncharacterized coiled-coil protein SlyX
MPNEARLENLEIKCAHLESSLDALSDVVYQQQQSLDQAMTMVRMLAKKLEDASGQDGTSAEAEERPPHY